LQPAPAKINKYTLTIILHYCHQILWVIVQASLTLHPLYGQASNFENCIKMEYSKLIAVTGLTGLFELVSSKNDGAIVKSLETGATQFVSSRKHQFSHLESIEIYTVTDNVNLVEVFKAMQANADKALPDAKDVAALKAYFGEVYPDMDFERVYASDMKKMVRWFTQIQGSGIDLKLTERTENATAEVVN